MRCGALAALMRYATIDLGVEIDIDVEPLRLRDGGTSGAHYAVGVIRYPGGEVGSLIYLKASVVGDESEVIREYRARHPAFPQESTAEQVFEEDQFEAYRALGFHIGAGLFGDRRQRPMVSADALESWLAGLGPKPDDGARPPRAAR